MIKVSRLSLSGSCVIRAAPASFVARGSTVLVDNSDVIDWKIVSVDVRNDVSRTVLVTSMLVVVLSISVMVDKDTSVVVDPT